ncbi:hypothetical protein SiH_0169 [Sulfolobus islandicus HVE10/4]|uniref:Uncharacterized protein n=1 Tax=Saccharolobus islandicus (strain HVE10/4) TaxID=930943 RepID=F0NJ27_SACI0|nr:hypothetical protein SiH_0169 [Sulfolobus islandicus HVE10/4]
MNDVRELHPFLVEDKLECKVIALGREQYQKNNKMCEILLDSIICFISSKSILCSLLQDNKKFISIIII